MAQGLRAAGSGADGYLLFTDADIAWEAHTLRRLVAAAEGDDRDLVSQMALLRTATGWERVVVPAFVYFFAQLYPFRRVNLPGSRTAAAAGGCMLIPRGAGLAGWALMSLSYLPMLRLYRLSPLRAPGLPLIALLYAAMTADSARRHYAGRGAEWRGRTNLR